MHGRSPLRATLAGMQPLLPCLGPLKGAIGEWLRASNAPRRRMSRAMTIERMHGSAGAAEDPAARRLDQMRNYFGEQVAPRCDGTRLAQMRPQRARALSFSSTAHLDSHHCWQVALYFAFLESFTNSLLPLAAVGTPVFAGGWISYGRADNPAVLFYSVCTLLWILLFIQVCTSSIPCPAFHTTHSTRRIPSHAPRILHPQYWRRQEARLAYRWGTEGFGNEERERREFSRSTHDEMPGFYTPEGWFVSRSEIKTYLVAAAAARSQRMAERNGYSAADANGWSHEECPLKREDVSDFSHNHAWVKTKLFTIEERWPLQALSISVLAVVTVCAAAGTFSLLTTMTILQVSFRTLSRHTPIHHYRTALLPSPAVRSLQQRSCRSRFTRRGCQV